FGTGTRVPAGWPVDLPTGSPLRICTGAGEIRRARPSAGRGIPGDVRGRAFHGGDNLRDISPKMAAGASLHHLLRGGRTPGRGIELCVEPIHPLVGDF